MPTNLLVRETAAAPVANTVAVPSRVLTDSLLSAAVPMGVVSLPLSSVEPQRHRTVTAAHPGRSAMDTLATTASLVRDLAFLHLAEDDKLAELGYHYGNIRPQCAHDASAIDETIDALIMNWIDSCVDPGGIIRQRLCLAVVGPSVRVSKDLHRAALSRAGEYLLSRAEYRSPITAIRIGRPHVMQSVGGTLVTVGFDIYHTD